MTQSDFGNLSSPLNGSTFFDSKLEPWRDTLHSMHKGNNRPTYAVAGMIWVKDSTNPWVLNIFDGSDDIPLGTVDTTTNLFTPANIGTLGNRTIVGGGGITVTNGSGAGGNPTLSIANTRTIFIPAGAMRPSSTGGCASLALVATAANQPDISSLDFDKDTQEYAQFSVRMPKAWDEGTVVAYFHWSHAATTTNFGVRWGLQGVAISDDDTVAVNYGTAQEVTDTGGTTNDLYITPATSAITIAGTPAAGDQVFYRVYRAAANGADTLAIDARLMGITLLYLVDTLDDA